MGPETKCSNCTQVCEQTDGECTRSGLILSILRGANEGSEELLKILFPKEEK